MATTVLEKRLLLAGEWIETGEWLDVRSPYSGDVVGRVPKAGAGRGAAGGRRRRGRRCASRCRRTGAPRFSTGSPRLPRPQARGGRRRRSAPRPESRSRPPGSRPRRAMSTYTFAAVEARKLAGEIVPMDASQAGDGKLAFTLRVPRGVVGAISPFNFPLNLVAHKIAPALAAGCAVVLKPASQTPLSALLLAELETEAGLPAGWLNVARRTVRRDRRRPGRGRAGGRAHVHRLGRRRLEAQRARPAQARRPRARERDAGDRRGRRRSRRRRREAGRERVLLRRPELHLRAARSTSRAPPTTASSSGSSRGSRRCRSAIPPTRTPTSAR